MDCPLCGRDQGHDFPPKIYLDDTGVEIDNRDLGETWLTYEGLPGLIISVSIEFALELVKNALENAKEV